jgi:hypothetical protein
MKSSEVVAFLVAAAMTNAMFQLFILPRVIPLVIAK